MIYSLLLLAVAAPQAQQTVCPKLSVLSSAGKAGEASFIVSLDPSPAQDVTYSWTVSSGAIQEGQGTSNIRVEGTKGELVTATVEIGALPPDCGRTMSASEEYR